MAAVFSQIFQVCLSPLVIKYFMSYLAFYFNNPYQLQAPCIFCYDCTLQFVTSHSFMQVFLGLIALPPPVSPAYLLPADILSA